MIVRRTWIFIFLIVLLFISDIQIYSDRKSHEILMYALRIIKKNHSYLLIVADPNYKPKQLYAIGNFQSWKEPCVRMGQCEKNKWYVFISTKKVIQFKFYDPDLEGDKYVMPIPQKATLSNTKDIIKLLKKRGIITNTTKPADIEYEWFSDRDVKPAQPFGKPNIYLYPTHNIDLQVTLNIPNGSIITSLPDYGDGWNVSVGKNGLIDNKYKCLFYEADVFASLSLARGWVFTKDNFSEGMTKILKDIGLNDKEIADFIDYWPNRINWDKKYCVTYLLDKEEIEKAIGLKFSIKPDSLLRLFFYFEKSSLPINIEKPTITKFKRVGFTVVEWGGIYHGHYR